MQKIVDIVQIENTVILLALYTYNEILTFKLLIRLQFTGNVQNRHSENTSYMIW
jgi:hypothetical protein